MYDDFRKREIENIFATFNAFNSNINQLIGNY